MSPTAPEGGHPAITAPRLPTAPRPSPRRFAAPRLLLVEIASAVLLVFGVSGFFYLDLWKRAAEDLPHLLPEATLTWATTPPPRLALERVASFSRWSPPAALAPDGDDERPLARLPFFESEPDGEVFGLPLEQIRQIYKSADGVSLAVVPTDQGPASMLFIEVRDLLARKRVVARLAPFLEPLHRHVGFQVETVRRSPWLRYAGEDLAAPRVVGLDPYLVFAWGPPDGLDELLDARVGGESNSLAARPGFLPPPREGGASGEFTGLLDPAAAWALVTGPDSDGDVAPHLFADLDLVTARARFVDDGELLDLRTHVTQRDTVDRLDQALANRPHELLEIAPEASPWVVSVIAERPLATLAALREAALRLGRELEPTAGAALRALGDQLSATEIEAMVRLDWEVATAFAGEYAWMALPPEPGAPADAPPETDAWAVVARLARPPVVEQALDRLLPFLLGDDYAYGTILVDGLPLHLVRPALAGVEGAADTDEVLAWRVDGPLLEMAPRAALLDRLHLFQRSGQTYGDGRLARRTLAPLPDESAIVLLARPDVLRRGAPGAQSVLDLVARRLAPDFRVAVALRAELPWLRVVTNVGPWTLAGAVAQATRDEVNAITLPGLDPQCREAHLAMCRIFPDAVPCHPLSLGRRAHIQRACAALFAPP